MEMVSIVTYAAIILNTVDLCFTSCVDELPDPECQNLAAAGECFFNSSTTGTSCLCQKSCGLCDNPKFPGEHDNCDCISFFPVCYSGETMMPLPGCPLSWSSDCYVSSQIADGYMCDFFPPSGDLILMNPTARRHADQIEFQCPPGYNKVGDSRGLHVCDADAAVWRKHSVYGDFPICGGASCGIPPRVLYATPSLIEDTLADEVTYSCQSGTVKLSGNDGKHACTADGSWKLMTGSVTPYCQPYIGYFKILPGNEAVANKTLSIKPGSSDIYCGALCLQSYFCVGYTYDDVNHVCRLNESGERAQNTEYTLIYPY
ncbi:complement decay-accelerating factor, GPI-anchored [Patella vulgata]|uniref:complement decay-accelerating factor, GPI-anchored n=1 Tax=Patella vulgata TaxID=6465 RepID=UPI0024A9872C|nr:complement decay-accelerating factor, GPI-anchored [Patella vulgata]